MTIIIIIINKKRCYKFQYFLKNHKKTYHHNSKTELTLSPLIKAQDHGDFSINIVLTLVTKAVFKMVLLENPNTGFRDCVLSGLSLKTCPAWLDLPGAWAPAGIALEISETHKLLHHSKVTAQVGETITISKDQCCWFNINKMTGTELVKALPIQQVPKNNPGFGMLFILYSALVHVCF